MRSLILFVAALGLACASPVEPQAADEPPAAPPANEGPLVLCIVAPNGQVGTCAPTADIPPDRRKVGPISAADGRTVAEVVVGTLDLVTQAEANLPRGRAQCEAEAGDPQACAKLFDKGEADIAKSRRVLEGAQP